MLTNKVIEYYQELLDEVKDRSREISTQVAFKEEFIACLVDAGVTALADCELVEYKKEFDKIKLDGFAFSEYFHTLTLLVSDFELKDSPPKMGKGEIDRLTKRCLSFYKKCLTDYFDDTEETGDGYRAYSFVKEHQDEIESIQIVLITNCDTPDGYVPEETRVGKIAVRFDVWDIERLYQCVVLNNMTDEIQIKLKKKYNTMLPMVQVPGDSDIYDCYVGVISGELLARIYQDEGQRLIEKNVRSYLQATGKVNKGIKVTLETAAEMFMAYNNGISTIATQIVAETEIKASGLVNISLIEGWQIVNGGQTTNSIANAYRSKKDISQVSVQIKLTVIKDIARADEIIANISRYANSQNKINMSDFCANDDYHIKMERLSRNTYIPVAKGGKSLDRWFYERARGQYAVEVNRQTTPATKRQFKEHNPKSRCVSKTVSAKCVMSWMGFPHFVSKGLETNFVEFSTMVSEGTIPAPSEKTYIEMIAKVILFNACDKVIADQHFGGWKAQQVYYTVALLGKYCPELLQPESIWPEQDISAEAYGKINELMFIVWDHFQHPLIDGINIGQWCKKKECWDLLQARYEQKQQKVGSILG